MSSLTKFRQEFREELKRASPLKLAIRSSSGERRKHSKSARENRGEKHEPIRAESTEVRKKVDLLLESLREKEWRDLGESKEREEERKVRKRVQGLKGKEMRSRSVSTKVRGIEGVSRLESTFRIAKYDEDLVKDERTQIMIVMGEIEELKNKLVELEGRLGPANMISRAVAVFQSVDEGAQQSLNLKLERMAALVVQIGRTLLMSKSE